MEVANENVQTNKANQLPQGQRRRDCPHYGRSRRALIITQNGEAKAVVEDIDSYEQTQETLALLKILALGNQQIEAGEVQPASDVIAELRNRQPSG